MALVAALVQTYEQAHIARATVSYVELYNALATTLATNLDAVDVVVVDVAGPEREETVAVMKCATQRLTRPCAIHATEPAEAMTTTAALAGSIVVLVDKVGGIELMTQLRKRCRVVALGEPQDSSFCHQAIEAGASQAYAKPLCVRKALDVLVQAGVGVESAFRKEDETRAATASDAVVWSSALFDAEGRSVRPVDVAPRGSHAVVAFVPSLASDDAVSLRSRNMLRQLNFYAEVLAQIDVKTLAVCCEDRDVVARAVADLDLRFALLSDVSLVFSSAYAGVAATDVGVFAPNPGLFYLDETGSLARAATRASREDDTLDHAYIEAAFVTAASISGKFAGAISAAHYLRSLDDGGGERIESPWRVGGFVRGCLSAAQWTAFETSTQEVTLKTLRIKMKASDLADDGVPPEARSGEARRAARVLVVEDSRTSADLIIRKIMCLGHCALYAPDGRAAWSLLKNFGSAVDVVISDVLMPCMDGVELLSRIKADARLSTMSVVLLTGVSCDDANLDAVCADLGGSSVLSKPAPTSALRDAIRSHLAKAAIVGRGPR